MIGCLSEYVDSRQTPQRMAKSFTATSIFLELSLCLSTWGARVGKPDLNDKPI